MNASEAATGGSQMQAALFAGLDQLSQDQTVTFAQYTRVALAPDSSVFWVANGTTQSAKGSLHFSTDRFQDEDQTIGSNEFIFSSEAEVSAFNAIAPGTMLIGSWPFVDGQNLQIAFSSRGRFYQEANEWHYRGRAVYPAMQSQILNSMADLPTGPIVSNSLPIWLTQTTFGAGITVPVYPSWLVPDNVVPPYVVVNIDPRDTITLAAAPLYDWSQQHVVPSALPVETEGGLAITTESGQPLEFEGPFYALPASQLCRDEVSLILYGFTNAMAWQYWSNLQAYSLTGPDEQPTFGFANSPVIRDEKRTQAEIATIAQKKRIDISANYYQGAADAAAFRLLLEAGLTVVINPLP